MFKKLIVPARFLSLKQITVIYLTFGETVEIIEIDFMVDDLEFK